MHYVIAYDISSDRRRNRVSEFLLGQGRRVQKSVFECDLSPEQLQRIRRELTGMLQVPPDRCHIYRLCATCISQRDALGGDLEPAQGPIVVV